MNILESLALVASEAEAGASQGLFQALGIDVKLLVLQGIAFLILVALFGKFVYPILIRAIDKRQEQIEAGTKASEEAQKRANEAEANLEKQMKDARTQADDIIATAHKEATDMVALAEKRAETKAEHIVSEAKASLENDITAARAALRKETTQLVAVATEKIIGEKLDAKKDSGLIERALKEAK